MFGWTIKLMNFGHPMFCWNAVGLKVKRKNWVPQSNWNYCFFTHLGFLFFLQKPKKTAFPTRESNVKARLSPLSPGVWATCEAQRTFLGHGNLSVPWRFKKSRQNGAENHVLNEMHHFFLGQLWLGPRGWSLGVRCDTGQGDISWAFFWTSGSVALGPSNMFALWEWKLSGGVPGSRIPRTRKSVSGCVVIMWVLSLWPLHLHWFTRIFHQHPGFVSVASWGCFGKIYPSPKKPDSPGIFPPLAIPEKLDRSDAGSKSCNQWPGWPYAAGQEVFCHKNVEGKKDSNWNFWKNETVRENRRFWLRIRIKAAAHSGDGGGRLLVEILEDVSSGAELNYQHW